MDYKRQLFCDNLLFVWLLFSHIQFCIQGVDQVGIVLRKRALVCLSIPKYWTACPFFKVE